MGEDKKLLFNAIQQCIPSITDRKIRKKWEKILAQTEQSLGSKFFKLGDNQTNEKPKKKNKNARP